MLNAQADTKATSTAEGKPDQRAKEQGKANTAATASAATGKPNGKAAKGTTAQAAKPPAQAKSGKKRKRKSAGAARTNSERKRGRKPYPVVAFADVLPLAEGIWKHNSGQEVVRTTLLTKMGLDPGAQSTRNLITNSNKYGATEGSYAAPNLKLTEKGLLAVSPKANLIDQKKARFALAIGDVEEFNTVFEKRKGNNMPAPEMLHDDLAKLDAGDRKACADVFTSNVKHLGMLVDRDGAQYLMTLEEWLGQKATATAATGTAALSPSADGTPAVADTAGVDFDKVCFVISTIKEDGSEQRKHADMIFSQYVDRALAGSNLKAVRADKIGDPGMISKQIIEYILKAKLVVADLSFHNPNVFYELALRHVTGKPTVHLTRTQDKPPFDVGNFRAITIDTTSVETAVMQLDTLRAEISTAITKTLANGESRDNPILTYCPNAKFVIDGQ
jgi:hypothetical protein